MRFATSHQSPVTSYNIMSIPFKYAVENLRMRRMTAGATVAGVALVVFVFAAVLMMAHGVDKTLSQTGSKENVIITRKGSNNELSSIVMGETQGIIRSLPYIRQSTDATQIVSTEPVVVINLHKPGGGMSNVTVRGVSPTVTDLRPQLKIVSGRMFDPSLRELIVGEPLTKRFTDGHIGDKVRFAGDDWEVVGVFECGGGGYESEIWGNSVQLLESFNRGNAVSSVTLKLTRAGDYAAFKAAFDAETRLKEFEVDTEEAFFAKQSEGLAGFIKILGIFITVIFSIGATVGAMITMYGAVANRTIEIGTMRSLGFSRRSILVVFLAESVLISLAGSIIGVLLASVLSFYQISTLNFSSFAEIAFSFALSPKIVVSSLFFGVAMGFLGGFLPAVKAARMNIVNALRAA